MLCHFRWPNKVDSPSIQNQAESHSPWIGISNPIFFYCYSAYLDDRPYFKHNVHHQVVVPSLVENIHLHSTNITCVLEYQTGDDVQIIQTPALALLAGWEKDHDYGKGSWTIHCSVTELGQQPTSVTLIHFNSQRTICKLPIQFPIKPRFKQDLCACVAPVYHMPQCRICKPQNLSQNLVPWLEMQKILGVNSVTIYNHSMTTETSLILEYYIKKGFVKVRHHGPIDGYTHRLPNAIAANDCLYQNLYTCKKLMIIDLDEYIVPQQYSAPLHLVTRWIAKQYHVPFSGTHFVFANTLYYKDHPKLDLSKARYYPMFRHQHRTDSEPFPGGCKSIIDPQSCKYTTLHMCTYDWVGRRILVHPRIASLHHYKDCASSWWKPKNKTCEEIFKSMVPDDRMLMYEDTLKDKVLDVQRDLFTFQLANIN